MSYPNLSVEDKSVDPEEFSISFTVRSVPSSIKTLPYSKVKRAILGGGHDVSLVFVGNSLSRSLNRHWRGKDKPTNILSFPLSKNSGEIFINLPLAEREAGQFGKNLKDFVLYLFIHGLLHLKGLGHCGTMEKAERKFQKKF